MNNFSEIWLPQINDNYTNDILNELKKEGIIVKKIVVDPSLLKPLQKKVNKTKVENIHDVINKNEFLPPSWVDANNYILDGHHRCYAFQSRPDIAKIEVYKVFLNKNDAARILNKIQDKIEFKKEYNINDEVNKFEPVEKEIKKVEKTKIKEEEKPEKQEDLNFDDVENKTITLYSVRKFDKNTKNGFIMSFTKENGYDNEYEIVFDKVLTVPKEEMDMYDPFYLSALYILEPDFEKDINKIKKFASENNKLHTEFIKDRLNGFAKRVKYDGINFGNKIILIIT
jgi:hypothetical protein